MSEFDNEKICIKSPAKINLHLEIIRKREDQFHELAMIMQNIDLADFLEFETNKNGLIQLESDNDKLTLASDNLIVKSANLLKKQFDVNLGANIFLRKNIPIGAGLAGGSSNAAATIIGLNKLWDLKLDNNLILSLSANLGSDVPFFIKGGYQLCFGRGEILEKLNANLQYGVLLLKNPNVSISTAETYKKYSKKFFNRYCSYDNQEKIRDKLRINCLNNFDTKNKSIKIINDLQLIVEEENDSVKLALNLLSKLKNCLTFAMSGSGPTCFALFKDVNTANQALEENCQLFKNNGFDSWVCKLLDEGITFL